MVPSTCHNLDRAFVFDRFLPSSFAISVHFTLERLDSAVHPRALNHRNFVARSVHDSSGPKPID